MGGRGDARIAGEQRNPQRRLDRNDRPIRPRVSSGRAARGPGDPRARVNEAGADRHADHRDRGDPKRERDRDQQEFQPRTHAIAGQRLGAEAGQDLGEDQDGEHGLQRRQASHRADLEDVEEHGALKRKAEKFSVSRLRPLTRYQARNIMASENAASWPAATPRMPNCGMPKSPSPKVPPTTICTSAPRSGSPRAAACRRCRAAPRRRC